MNEEKTSRRAGRGEFFWLLAPMALLILLVFDLPILKTALWSVTDPKTGALTGHYYGEFFSTPIYVGVIWRTIRVAAEVTAVTVLFGYILAYWTTRLGPRARLVVSGIVVTTFWVSILVRTYAWIVILGNGGLVNRALVWLGLADAPVSFLYNELGIVIGMVNVLLPFFVLPVQAAMMRIDPHLTQVAETLGASQTRIFWLIFLPLTFPAVSTAAILIFILSLGFYITPAVLGGGRVPLVANMMDMMINRFADWEMAAVVSVILLFATLSLYTVYQFMRSRT